ncbi:MAG: quinolinate synthase NadA [Candidatus Lokiarchaeota archaeon]|nr:quinolinate synthase NadA [Candidatus Lokiarchaeota archaeon]
MDPSSEYFIRKLPEIDQELIYQILELKKEKNVLILAHNYQCEGVQLVADLLGDSLGLAKKVIKATQNDIIFAGVRFMAETAKVLNPNKRIHFPATGSLCDMAAYLKADMIREYKLKNPGIPVVLYINSTAESKTLADIVCTSSNAVNIVKYIQQQTNAPKIAFGPDKNLGAYICKMSGIPIDIIPPHGNCYVHDKYTIKDVSKARKQHPEATLLIHPEAPLEVLDLADYIGSTSMIIHYPVEHPQITSYIIGTEIGVTEQLRRNHPEKTFSPLNENAICTAMKSITLKSILDCIKNIDSDKFIVEIQEDIMKKSQDAINKMIEVR